MYNHPVRQSQHTDHMNLEILHLPWSDDWDFSTPILANDIEHQTHGDNQISFPGDDAMLSMLLQDPIIPMQSLAPCLRRKAHTPDTIRPQCSLPFSAPQGEASSTKRRKKKATTLHDSDWEPFKKRIVELHNSHWPLKKIQQIMEKDFGFRAE